MRSLATAHVIRTGRATDGRGVASARRAPRGVRARRVHGERGARVGRARGGGPRARRRLLAGCVGVLLHHLLRNYFNDQFEG